jgi:hypothetical protein
MTTMRHQTPIFALAAQPRPADREIRARDIVGHWLSRLKA